MLQRTTTPSVPTVASSLPSGEKASERAAPEWAWTTRSSDHVPVSQTLTAPSTPAAASVAPSGENATPNVKTGLPSRSASTRSPAMFQMTTGLS